MIQRRPGSAAGNWLFCNRRWLDPADPADRARLHAGYDALLSLFPAALTEVPRALFIEHLSEVTTAWADVARDGFSRHGRRRVDPSESSDPPPVPSPSDPPPPAAPPPKPTTATPPITAAVCTVSAAPDDTAETAEGDRPVDFMRSPGAAAASHDGWCWWGGAAPGAQATTTRHARPGSVQRTLSSPPPPSPPPPSDDQPQPQPEPTTSAFQRVPPRSRPDRRDSGPYWPLQVYRPAPSCLLWRGPPTHLNGAETQAESAPATGLTRVAPAAWEETGDRRMVAGCREFHLLARPGGGGDIYSAMDWPLLPPLLPMPPPLALHAAWGGHRAGPSFQPPWAAGPFMAEPPLRRRWARAPAPWAAPMTGPAGPLAWPLPRDAAAAAAAAAWADWL